MNLIWWFVSAGMIFLLVAVLFEVYSNRAQPVTVFNTTEQSFLL